MSDIRTEVNRIRTNVSAALQAIRDTGVEVPEDANSDQLGSLIAKIPEESIAEENFRQYLENDDFVIIPSYVSKIKDYAFRESKLYYASFSEGLTSIGEQAFMSCSNLNFPSLPESLVEMKAQAFLNCTALTLTTLPNQLKNIPFDCFGGDIKLGLRSLPSELESIEDYAFQGCKSIDFSLVYYLGYAFPPKLKTIGLRAFEGCPVAKCRVKFSNELQAISEYAFSGCKMTEVYFEGKVNSLADTAFDGCESLKHIYFACSESEMTGAPWGATNAEIVYDYDVSSAWSE